MELVPPPPYKYPSDMTYEECGNKIWSLNHEIASCYTRAREIERSNNLPLTSIPEMFIHLPDAKPFPEVITPNVMTRQYRVDGTVGRAHYNCLRQIDDYVTLIEKIQHRATILFNKIKDDAKSRRILAMRAFIESHPIYYG